MARSEAHLTIGGLSTATGLKVETIRYYESIGLLAPPARTAGNYRSYGPAERRRLSFVRRSRNLGFSIEEIRALLQLSDQKELCCTGITDIARNHLRETEKKIADLERLAGELKRIINRCRGSLTMKECRIIDALSDEQ